MLVRLIAAAFTAAVLVAAPAFAEGDAAKGAKAFKKCQACHVVKNDAGEVLAGRSGKTGPNLYGLAGRTAGTVDGFGYSKSVVEAGEAGLVWDTATFTAFVMDPTGNLREVLGSGSARSKMSYKVRKDTEAADLYAFISGLE